MCGSPSSSGKYSKRHLDSNVALGSNIGSRNEARCLSPARMPGIAHELSRNLLVLPSARYIITITCGC
jgi:hypothetical protein